MSDKQLTVMSMHVHAQVRARACACAWWFVDLQGVGSHLSDDLAVVVDDECRRLVVLEAVHEEPQRR